LITNSTYILNTTNSRQRRPFRRRSWTCVR